MSYSECWNCYLTWNLCFLLIFSWKKLRPNFAFWNTFKLLRCLNSKEMKLQSSIKVICTLFSWNLKEHKDSKFNDDFNTSTMRWTRQKWKWTNKKGSLCALFFRIQAVFAHVQTFFNLPSLDCPIEFTMMGIEHLDQGYEARGSYLKYEF